MAEEVKVEEGWAFPSAASPKCHYFGKDRRSLCGKWAFFGTLDADNGKPNFQDCKACRVKLAKKVASRG